jgi:3-oxoacyl-[acyl-carrier-protein] synthase-1
VQPAQTIAYVLSVGARSSLGLSALQTAMCVRAKKSEPRSSEFLDKRGHSIGVCVTGGLPAALFGYERLVALAAPALIEAAAGRGSDAAPIPVALALPEPGRPDDDARFGRKIFEDLAAATGLPIDAARSVAVRAGNAGGALAIEAAASMLAAGAPAALVGGVDSYYHPDVLRWLDEECRLHSIEAENGFVPGEAAAFLLLSRPAAPRGARPLASLQHVMTDREETAASDEPNIARAMTQIVKSVADRIKEKPIPWVLTDINGERHRVREWTRVEARGSIGKATAHDRFAEDLGDIGAAFGPVLAAIACIYWQSGCAPARSAVVALHAEGAPRGAFLLEEAT